MIKHLNEYDRNLHSSMDRFEVPVMTVRLLHNTIYIPVWIDLKQTIPAVWNKTSKIYIPVWIDLKLYYSDQLQFAFLHLHSSMDRFEVNKHPADIRCTIIYIPVWIDLKASAKQPGVYLALGSVFCLPALWFVFISFICL